MQCYNIVFYKKLTYHFANDFARGLAVQMAGNPSCGIPIKRFGF